MKKVLGWLLCFVLLTVLLTACGGGADGRTTTEATARPAEKTALRLGLLAGPTGMGGARLLQEAAEGKTMNAYQHTIFNAPDEVTAKLISGELDIAAVPTNLAAVLYQKTKGGVQLLALNTLGVLHLVRAEGESITSLEDLKGKTIYSSGQAAVPEYVLDYILDSYGLKDQVTVVYEAEHDAVIAALAAGKAKLAVLPEPKVTAALSQVSGLAKALDLTAEWNKAVEKRGGEKAVLSMGCVVVRKETAQALPEGVSGLHRIYEGSGQFGGRCRSVRELRHYSQGAGGEKGFAGEQSLLCGRG